jgi:hypothetical protein
MPSRMVWRGCAASSPVVHPPIIRCEEPQLFLPVAAPPIHAALASYLRTNRHALSYGKNGGVGAFLPREFFFFAQTGWDTGTGLTIRTPYMR